MKSAITDRTSSQVERHDETLDLKYNLIAVTAKEGSSLCRPGALGVLVRLSGSMCGTACRLVDFGDFWVQCCSRILHVGLCCTVQSKHRYLLRSITGNSLRQFLHVLYSAQCLVQICAFH